jgi:hypothetical protein
MFRRNNPPLIHRVLLNNQPITTSAIQNQVNVKSIPEQKNLLLKFNEITKNDCNEISNDSFRNGCRAIVAGNITPLNLVSFGIKQINKEK